MLNDPIGRIRFVGMVEAVSFLTLLGIAMPLKYMAGLPMAVKVVGWAHGALFLALCYLVLHAIVELSWPVRRGAMVFVAALIPFGPFVIDKRLRAEQESRASGS